MTDNQLLNQNSGNRKRPCPSGAGGLPYSKRWKMCPTASSSRAPAPTEWYQEAHQNASRQGDESRRLKHGWQSFVSARRLTKLFDEHEPLSEREKYAGFLDVALNNVREVFTNSVDAGLRRLVATTDGELGPVEGETVEDLDAITSRIRARREEESFQGYVPACKTARVFQASADSLRTLEDALPQELDFTEVRYCKSMKVEGTGKPGCVAGRFEVVKKCADNPPYAGHRGGDFVFQYAGTQSLLRDSSSRFRFSGQVPRTAGEYEFRLERIKEAVHSVVKAALDFRLEWGALKDGRRHLVSENPRGASVEETERAYHASKQWLLDLDEKEGIFRMKMAKWVSAPSVVCEFGWLVEKRRRTGWRSMPADIRALEGMVTDWTMMQTYSLAKVYDERQGRIALKKLLEERAAGNEVVVCLHNTHEDLFPVPTEESPVLDPFRNTCTLPDLSRLVESALTSWEEEITLEPPASDHLVQQLVFGDSELQSAELDLANQLQQGFFANLTLPFPEPVSDHQLQRVSPTKLRLRSPGLAFDPLQPISGGLVPPFAEGGFFDSIQGFETLNLRPSLVNDQVP